MGQQHIIAYDVRPVYHLNQPLRKFNAHLWPEIIRIVSVDKELLQSVHTDAVSLMFRMLQFVAGTDARNTG